MKKLTTFILLALMALSSVSFAATYVKGHYRKGGTYVRAHHRSDPDGTTANNWGTKGNTNPYTLKRGTR
jgi:hypothetical protein